MALDCPECGYDVGRTTQKCPGCGFVAFNGMLAEIRQRENDE